MLWVPVVYFHVESWPATMLEYEFAMLVMPLRERTATEKPSTYMVTEEAPRSTTYTQHGGGGRDGVLECPGIHHRRLGLHMRY
jgi:hypothetical protein